MNVTHGETFDCYGHDPLIDIVAERLGDDCGIHVNQNCSIGEMAKLLAEIANRFDGDTASALVAIRAGELQFEERLCHDATNEWREWHIAPARQ
jgi:hypothetical protein